MSKFRIIPVIDILNSVIVHAVKGERENYKPLYSKLINSSNPIKFIEILSKNFEFREIYIADLDSILRGNPNLELFSKISKIPLLEIILDPGIIENSDLLIYSHFNIKKLIIGMETVSNFKVIEYGLDLYGRNKIIVSIDMYREKLITKMKDKNLLNVINKIEELGVNEIILLDLFRIGQKLGGIPPVYLKVLKNFSGNVLVGGGIKNIKDVLEYKNSNFSGILIATALYDGSINIDELKSRV